MPKSEQQSIFRNVKEKLFILHSFFFFCVGRFQLVGVVVASKQQGMRGRSGEFAFPRLVLVLSVTDPWQQSVNVGGQGSDDVKLHLKSILAVCQKARGMAKLIQRITAVSLCQESFLR